MISQYIRTPFANGGDKEDIPQSTQTNGSISWPQGWGPDYELDIETESDAKPIDRLDMNQLFYVITQGLKFLQENFAPEWIDSNANGGTAFQYQTGQTVTYTDSNGTRAVWVSLTDNNTATPGTDASKWGPYLYRTASTAEVNAESGNYPVTPQQVLDLIEDNRQTINDATTKAKGIVQLSDSLNGTSSLLAATEKAVGQKLSQYLTDLGKTNIETLNTPAARGLYMQLADANATTENGYPDGAGAGILLVAGSVNAKPMLVYFSSLTGEIWTKRGTSTGYTDWKNSTRAVQDGTTKQKGIVQLSDSEDSTSDTLAATASAVGKKLSFRGYLDASTDLATIKSENQRGVYCQNSNANAKSELNYPEQAAGILDAIGVISGGLFLRYTTIYGNIYTRWASESTWRKVNKAMPAGIITFVATNGKGTAPANMLVCNGAAVSRTTFADLFAKIGTTYGAGDGSTTFNLPNIPAGYGLTSNLGEAKLTGLTNGNNISHTHSASTGAAGSHTHTGSTAAAGVHTHTGSTGEAGLHHHTIRYYRASGAANRPYPGRATDTDQYTDFNTPDDGQHTHTVSIANAGSHSHTLSIANAGSHTHTVSVSASGGDLNLAASLFALPCITY